MGRLVRRVPLDFDWPLNVVWRGYVRPAEIVLPPCPACTVTPDVGEDGLTSEQHRPHRSPSGPRADALDVNCPACGGEGHVGMPSQAAAHDGWRETDPPAGEGWQLWETTSEGSPISPVFATADDLVAWMSHPDRGRHWLPAVVAAKFVAEGSAPSFVGSSTSGEGVSGAEFVGFHADLLDDGELTD